MTTYFTPGSSRFSFRKSKVQAHVHSRSVPSEGRHPPADSEGRPREASERDSRGAAARGRGAEVGPGVTRRRRGGRAGHAVAMETRTPRTPHALRL